VSECIIFGANNNNKVRARIIYYFFALIRPSSSGTIKRLNNAIKQSTKFGSEPRLAQAPDQILPIGVKDTAQTLILRACRTAWWSLPDGHGVAGGVAAQLRPWEARTAIFGRGLSRRPRIFPLSEKAALLVPAARSPPAHRREIRIGSPVERSIINCRKATHFPKLSASSDSK
jgi:hypothetical protein